MVERIPVIATFDRDERAALAMGGVGMTGREFMAYARKRASTRPGLMEARPDSPRANAPEVT